MSKPNGAVEISSTMYLFKSGTNASDCIISAHGGYVLENRAFKVPDRTTIHFYGDHGAALIDPGIGDFSKRLSKAKPRETLTAGQQCRNYLLTKYQGAHAGESGKEVLETYDMVSQSVQNRDKVRASRFTAALKSNGVPQQKQMELLMEDWGGSVLTIRNRWNVFMGVPLAEAIAAVQKASPSIRVFHCSFCRSNMLGEDKLAAQEVRYGV